VADALRIEKLKWDGTVAATHTGFVIPASRDATVWFVPMGTARDRPRESRSELVGDDEVHAAQLGEWWVLCGHALPGERISRYVLHAATPFEAPLAGVIRWVDLDLDFDVRGDTVSLDDETQFHEHARSMHYPPEVIHGAWEGISRVAPRFTTGEWPFDGWLDDRLDAARAEHATREQPAS
jgi:hypothetical protein